jgi:uncharacterized protein YjaZ
MMRLRWIGALAVVATLASGCSTDKRSGVSARPPASTPAAAPTASAPALGHFGLPVPPPGLHVDPAVVRLGRSVGVDVRRELQRTEQRVDRALHGRPVNIRVRVDDQHLVQETGVGGVTRLDTSILIDVEPDAPVGTRTTLQTWLPFVLAHELDHAVRFDDGPGLIGRMLDYFVSEGLADSFAAAMFPGLPTSPTDTGLSREQLHRYWQKAQDILYEIPPRDLHDQWLFGNRHFPSNTGYAIGTALIEAVRVHHPHLSWAALTRMAAQTILDISHFRP